MLGVGFSLLLLFFFFLKNERERKHFFKLCSFSFFSEFSSFPRQASVAQVRTEGSRLKSNTAAKQKPSRQQRTESGKTKERSLLSARFTLPAFMQITPETGIKLHISHSNPDPLHIDLGFQHQEPWPQQQGSDRHLIQPGFL